MPVFHTATAAETVELGRRLVREMDDHRSVDVRGQRIVPNDFVILLSPDDHTGFSDIEDTLRTELIEACREGNDAIRQFDTSCFSGEYVTGVDDGYLEKLQFERSDQAKALRREAAAVSMTG